MDTRGALFSFNVSSLEAQLLLFFVLSILSLSLKLSTGLLIGVRSVGILSLHFVQSCSFLISSFHRLLVVSRFWPFPVYAVVMLLS